MANHKTQKRMTGIGASEGIVYGRVVLVERERISIPHRILEPAQVGQEIERFMAALDRAKQGLQEIRVAVMSAPSHEPAFIIDAHLMMLEDELLVEGAIELISKERVNAEWALRRKVAELVATFSRMTDPYLKERGRDVEEVSERVIRELVGKSEEPWTALEEPAVVVAHELTPAETAHMAFERVLGFATNIGSTTSHAAIVAKSLRIPAVVGLKTITSEVAHGDAILIDGHGGAVIVNPSPQDIRDFERRQQALDHLNQELKPYLHLPAQTLDGFPVILAANLEILDEIQFLKERGAEGVGLYRTEYLYLDRKDLPSEDEHFEGYKQLVRATHPDGATIRTLDLGGDKFKSVIAISDELNPAMGLRAIRLCLHEPELFRTQLRAILRASAFGKARVMFPMISSFEEFEEANRILEEEAAKLRDQGVAMDAEIEVGAMIEVPSAAFIAEDLAQAVDFFSIGTNDLIQYTLAIDRINENVNYLYQPLHPAVLRIVRQVVNAGHQHGIPVYMCGAMAAEPFYLPVLIGLDLDELSMPMASILRIKKILRGIKKADAQALLEELFTYRSTEQIIARVRKEIQDRWGEAYSLERMFEAGEKAPG